VLSSLTFFFGLLAAYFWLQKRHSRTLLNNVIESIKSGRNSILEKSPFLSSDLPINDMQLVLDENFEKISKLQAERKNRIHAFNEILGGMVNGALILDANHRITFSNTSCNKIFGRGSEIKGRRLEAVIESIEVLEALAKISRGEQPNLIEFKFKLNGTISIFEMSAALLSKISVSEKEVYLLLFRDITEIRQAEIMRKDFVANASHELRTPITMIKGFSETLLEPSKLNEKYRRDFINKIFKNSIRLQTLVDDLLSLSELEGSQQPISPTTNKLCDILKGIDIYLQDKPHIDTNKIKFDIVEEEEGFLFDAIKVALAIGNLIDNAFKYAGDCKKVLISTKFEDQGKVITCSVRDDGNGIPEPDLKRIFERFYVVDKGRSREKGGTGLGLSIVKHIAEAHGGYVSAESELGKGSVFNFSLPRFP